MFVMFADWQDVFASGTIDLVADNMGNFPNNDHTECQTYSSLQVKLSSQGRRNGCRIEFVLSFAL